MKKILLSVVLPVFLISPVISPKYALSFEGKLKFNKKAPQIIDTGNCPDIIDTGDCPNVIDTGDCPGIVDTGSGPGIMDTGNGPGFIKSTK